MKIIYPPESKIIQIQNQEQKYYYSHCIETIFRKNGFLSLHRYNQDTNDITIICRNTAWKEEYKDNIIYAEGPCCDSLYKEFGIEYIEKSGEDINIEYKNSQNIAGYGLINVRKIPKIKREKYGDIVPFFSQKNNFYNNNNITYHSFKENPCWEPIMYGIDENNRKEIIGIKKDKVIILGIPLFDIVVCGHAFPELEDKGYYDLNKYINIPLLENILINTIEDHVISNDGTILKISEWPSNYKAALSIRHDFDRPINNDHLKSILSFYNKHKFKATWFWLTTTYNNHQIDMVLSQNHEIALHNEESKSPKFFKELEYFAKRGIQIKGFSCHGGAGADGYLGSTTMKCALEAGLEYGELLGHFVEQPVAAILTDKNNVHKATPLMLPCVHLSFDKSVKPNEHYSKYLNRTVPSFLDQGTHVVIMNHPDIHQNALQEFLVNVKRDNVWYETLENVCKWTKFSRYDPSVIITSDCLSIEFFKASQYDFQLILKTKNLEKYIDVKRGAENVVIKKVQDQYLSYIKMARHLSLYFSDFEFLIRQAIPDRKSAQSTITVNTTQLEKRAQSIIDMVNISSSDTVMELGSGYGFLSVAINMLTGAKVQASDISISYLSVAESLLKRLPEFKDQIDFKKFDYTVYNEALVDSVDIIILNNTFCYIPYPKQKETIFLLYKYLKKGGRIVFYQPNPYFYIEPFTKLPFVHWLPKVIGEYVVQKLGKRTLKDLHYNPPGILYFWLKAASFKKIRYVPNGNIFYKKKGLKRFLTPYYGMTAEK
jgi:SAM-dependent methyltransferase